MLLKKGARMSNVVAFLTAKAAAEVPLIVMESKFLGARFALVRVSRGWSGVDSDLASP
jgi:uncharacterized membrane protein YraQ (UPF0718 family)